MSKRCCGSGVMQSTIRHAAVIFAPRHLDGVGSEIFAADVVMLADLGAT